MTRRSRALGTTATCLLYVFGDRRARVCVRTHCALHGVVEQRRRQGTAELLQCAANDNVFVVRAIRVVLVAWLRGDHVDKRRHGALATHLPHTRPEVDVGGVLCVLLTRGFLGVLGAVALDCRTVRLRGVFGRRTFGDFALERVQQCLADLGFARKVNELPRALVQARDIRRARGGIRSKLFHFCTYVRKKVQRRIQVCAHLRILAAELPHARREPRIDRARAGRLVAHGKHRPRDSRPGRRPERRAPTLPFTMAPTASTSRGALLGAIAALSITTGIAVSYLAVHAPPKPQFSAYAASVLSAARREVGLTPHGRFFSSRSPMAEEAEKFYLMLVRIFQELTSTPFGKGAFLFIFSMTSPLVMFSNVEALKPQAHLLMGGIAVTIIFLTGQLICIGAALPLFYIPVVALVRALRPRDTFPQRAFNESAIPLIKLLQLAAGLPALLTVVIPPKHKHYFLVNSLFQFFPLIFVHLSGYKLVAGRSNSVSSRAVGDLYRSSRFSSTLLYWLGVYLMFPTLLHLAKGSWVPFTDAVKLILWDALGVFLSIVFLVVINLVADPAPVGITGYRNMHAGGPHLVAATFKAAATALVFGPGTAMFNYLAKREDAVAPVHPGFEVLVEDKAQ